MTVSSSKPSPYLIVFCLGESLIIIGGVALAIYFRMGTAWEIGNLTGWPLRILIVPFVIQVTYYYFELYNFRNAQPFMFTVVQLAQATSLGGLVLAVIYYLLPSFYLGRGVLIISAVIVFISAIIWRASYIWALKQHLFTIRVLLVASGSLADSILEEIVSRSDNYYKVVCILDTSEQIVNGDETTVNEINLLENWALLLRVERRLDIEHIVEIVHSVQADMVVVAMDEKRERMPREGLIELRMLGVPIILGEDFFELVGGRIMANRIVPSWLIFSPGFSTSGLRRMTKRLVDITISSVGLLISIPLILLTVAAIKIDSRGPVIYRQERVGRHDNRFEIYKFRSMVADAEKATGPVWATRDDERVTRVGHVIRKVRLDEIPQMWNVLKGDMSFVGPRPERPVFVDKLSERIPFYQERHNVEPGITGLAQICFPYGSSEAAALEKLNYDLYYIKHSSLSLDILILIKTIKIILFGGGGR